MAEISTDLKCHCGGAVVHKIEKIYKGNNGILGYGARSFHDIKQTFKCSDCSTVYVPTEKNGLKFLPEADANVVCIKASQN